MTLCLEILAECLKNTKSQYEELMLLVPKPSVREVLFEDEITNLLFFCLNIGNCVVFFYNLKMIFNLPNLF